MQKYRIPNLGKACDVIQLISNSPEGCSLRHISKQLSIPRTTALRITETLLHSRFLSRTEDGSYILGTTLVELGMKSLNSLDIREFARPVLKQLSLDTGESCHLAILNGDKSLLVEVADSLTPVRIASRPGTLVELHCSSTGKVFLAFAVPKPSSFCKSLPLTSHTDHTDTSVTAVLKSIKVTRKQGFALDEQEYVSGVRCVAAPVINAFGKTIAAVGITSSTRRFTQEMILPMSEKVKAAAAKISADMGFST